LPDTKFGVPLLVTKKLPDSPHFRDGVVCPGELEDQPVTLGERRSAPSAQMILSRGRRIQRDTDHQQQAHPLEAQAQHPGENDCVDLVVTKFTPNEVDFHFGPFYTANTAKFNVTNGDHAAVWINGAQKTVHVAYGAATS
jgi:hypothetical protein